MRFISFIFCSK